MAKSHICASKRLNFLLGEKRSIYTESVIANACQGAHPIFLQFSKLRLILLHVTLRFGILISDYQHDSDYPLSKSLYLSLMLQKEMKLIEKFNNNLTQDE